MKKPLFYLLIISFISFYSFVSCNDEESLVDKSLHWLSIDPNASHFIDENGLPYIENTLVSQQDSHVYKLSMEKGIKYRISTSQPESFMNQTMITLVNIEGDTLAESLGEDPKKASIVIRSPETADYFAIVRLTKRTNPQFIYRLFFETFTDEEKNFGGQTWSASGSWENVSENSLALKNYDSRIYRHLKLLSTEYANNDLSFTIRNTGNNSPNFGLILNGSDDFVNILEYSNEIPSGTGFLTVLLNNSFSIYTSVANGVGYRWGSLSEANIDFQKGVKVDLKFEENRYWVYVNNIRLDYFENGNLNYFYIVVEDAGNDKTLIENFVLH